MRDVWFDSKYVSGTSVGTYVCVVAFTKVSLQLAAFAIKKNVSTADYLLKGRGGRIHTSYRCCNTKLETYISWILWEYFEKTCLTVTLCLTQGKLLILDKLILILSKGFLKNMEFLYIHLP